MPRVGSQQDPPSGHSSVGESRRDAAGWGPCARPGRAWRGWPGSGRARPWSCPGSRRSGGGRGRLLRTHPARWHEIPGHAPPEPGDHVIDQPNPGRSLLGALAGLARCLPADLAARGSRGPGKETTRLLQGCLQLAHDHPRLVEVTNHLQTPETLEILLASPGQQAPLGEQPARPGEIRGPGPQAQPLRLCQQQRQESLPQLRLAVELLALTLVLLSQLHRSIGRAHHWSMAKGPGKAAAAVG